MTEKYSLRGIAPAYEKGGYFVNLSVSYVLREGSSTTTTTTDDVAMHIGIVHCWIVIHEGIGGASALRTAKALAVQVSCIQTRQVRFPIVDADRPTKAASATWLISFDFGVVVIAVVADIRAAAGTAAVTSDETIVARATSCTAAASIAITSCSAMTVGFIRAQWRVDIHVNVKEIRGVNGCGIRRAEDEARDSVSHFVVVIMPFSLSSPLLSEIATVV